MEANKAYIIGILNKAIYFEKEQAFIVSGEKDSHSYPLIGYEWSQIRAVRPEYYYYDYSSISHLKEITKIVYQQSEALEMALELMDTNLSNEYRSGISEILAGDLENKEELFSYVKNRLLSTPTPGSFDPEQAYSYILPYSEKVAALYHDLSGKTKHFAAFYTLLKFELNLELEKQDFVDQTLTDLGYYSKFSEALYENSKNKYDSAVVLTLIKLQELHISHSPEIFFKIENKLERDYKIVLAEIIIESQKPKRIEESITKPAEKEDEIILLIEAYFAQKQIEHDSKLSKRGKAKKVKDYAIDTFDTVEILKEWSKKYANKSDDAFLHKFKDIIKNQLRTSRPEHTSKTCCDIASYLTQINRFSLSKKLLGYAKRLTPEDPVIYTQEAELSNRLGSLSKALELYNIVIKNFSNNVVAYNGKAETLRDMGKSEEALKQYDLTIQKFDNVVAYCGKAETLRDMGKPEEALKQYDLTIQKFDNVVAYSGKAETLIDLGKPEEALKQYDLTIQKFDDVVAYCGKAETLRDLGKPEEALKQYDLTIQKFDNVVAYSGKAETLRDMGKPEEALKQYDLTIQKFDDVVAYSGKAETLRDMGKPEEALKQYDLTIQKFEYVVAYTGKAETLRDMGKPEEALKQYDLTIQKFDDVFAYCGKAETLRDLGKSEEALKQYNLTIQNFDNVVAYTGKAETLRDLGKPTDALKIYEQISLKYPYNDIIQIGYCKTLIEMGDIESLRRKVVKPYYKTFRDFFYLHIYSLLLIKTGDWEKANDMIKMGLNSPFQKNILYFKRLACYLKILKKEYKEALSYFDLQKPKKPSENLLLVHAFAENNNKSEAKEILHKIEHIKRPLIKNTLTYLSERYVLNGFEKSGKSKEDLDKLIIEGEMKALLQN